MDTLGERIGARWDSHRMLVGAGWGAVATLVMSAVMIAGVASWGLFGTASEPRIAVATLLLHLVYGASLGLLLQRSRKVAE